MVGNTLKRKGRRVSIQQPANPEAAPVAADVTDPFEVAEDAPDEDIDYDLRYSRYHSSHEDLPRSEEQFILLPMTKAIPIEKFDPAELKHLRICPKFFLEGAKRFRFVIEYEAIKFYEDSKSEPLTLKFQKDILLEIRPPFNIFFDYQVNDWYTSELNFMDRNQEGESLTKVPTNQKIPLLVEIQSSSKYDMTIHSISLDVIETDVFKQNKVDSEIEEQMIGEGDSIGTEFEIEAIRDTQDTGEFADVLIEWSRKLEHDNSIFKQVCRLPTSSISVVKSPLEVTFNTSVQEYEQATPFTMDVELKNMSSIIMEV